MLRMVAEHNGSWLDWKAFNRVYEKDCSSWTTSTQSTAERYRIEHGFSLGINEDAHAKLKLCIAIIFRSRIYIITIFAFFSLTNFLPFSSLHAIGSYYNSVELVCHLMKFRFMNQKLFRFSSAVESQILSFRGSDGNVAYWWAIDKVCRSEVVETW